MNHNQEIKSNVQNDNHEIITIPTETKWHSICIPQFARIDETNRYFCRYWEINLFGPVFSTLIFAYCYVVFIIATYLYLSIKLKIASIVETSIFLILFLWSFFAASCMDPGFLPYNWSSSKKTWYSWEEQLTYLAISKEQIDFAKSHERAPSSVFSTQSGRFVLRGDHICGWISNWVGKRNHKQFILFGFYGSFLAISMFIWQFFIEINLKRRNITLYYLQIVASILECLFFLILFFTSLHHFILVSKNLTTLQHWKKKETKQLSFIQSLREVFGKDALILWLCPTPAFGKHIELLSE